MARMFHVVLTETGFEYATAGHGFSSQTENGKTTAMSIFVAAFLSIAPSCSEQTTIQKRTWMRSRHRLLQNTLYALIRDVLVERKNET